MTYSQQNKKPSWQKQTMNKKLKAIDPSLLPVRSEIARSTCFEPTLAFAYMPLHPFLKKSVYKKGYIMPTEVQERCIPAILEGADIIGIASTGTGKTAAFLIPFVQQLLRNKNHSGLVVVPTRELAQQIFEEFKSLTAGMNFRAVCFIGGTPISSDISQTSLTNHLIISTPGRLLDLVRREAIHLDTVKVLILDEFDRMLDMGFINDVKAIISYTALRKQTLLFSATIKASQKKLIDTITNNPAIIDVSSGHWASASVEQNMLEVGPHEDKLEVLFNLLSKDNFKKVMLFAETKRIVDKVNKQLVRKGIKSNAIHGNKSQNYRTKAIEEFKAGHTRVLIATDVASRGLDVQNVTHVINYQLPQNIEAYIHRIGRTGRAGKKGIAYTFIN
ncbi:DEAD/DEAH box helicase [Niabella insulamsoli]|uniref:DEAD/DEAH box helicase n=1 Tax=Niabella insulamsoli TaxID=3144874 RepID=UPI0031FE33C1